ncbi:thioredoxin family protein [Rhodoferax saidenbachensis]|uniref:Thiol reductase thioredoxin n=1 Tax=Rhodoferax saidenbachensis TaxID=1484693 RepID=A0A1P8KB78_9BURK|nr:thioredoxin family protein [Rhodoferax saidenbachensis]APW43274.1 thiol reductase thioredoxin [Rhodoferax saidenbachensis]
MSQTTPSPAVAPLLVACLCAAWCGTCTDYQPLFAQLQKDFPGVRFVWVDIEDESELVDPIEVENFPTLLIAAGENTRFFGTVTPHLETLRRLIQSAAQGGSSVTTPDVVALTQRLRTR